MFFRYAVASLIYILLFNIYWMLSIYTRIYKEIGLILPNFLKNT